MKILKIIVGVLLILGGIKGIIDSQISASLVMILIGALLIKTWNSEPPKNSKNKSKK